MVSVKITAPLYAVSLFDHYKSYNSTLYVTAIILFLGIVILYFHKDKEHIHIA